MTEHIEARHHCCALTGMLPQQQCADLYRETGPDGLGALGSEPSCTLTLFETSAATAQQPVASTPSAHASHVPAAWTLSCGPHKLLAAQRCVSGDGAMLLGLSDDVDCAVVRVLASQGEPLSAQVRAVSSTLQCILGSGVCLACLHATS